MRYLIYRPKQSTVFVALATAVALAGIVALMLPGNTATAQTTFSCSGVQIKPGNDLDAIVNKDPGDRATTFCVHAASSGTTYTINNTVVLRTGDRLIGQPGQVVTRGPASYGVPPVKIRNGASLDKLVALNGSNVQLSWLDIAGGAGKYTRDGSNLHSSGKGIAAGQTDGTARMEYLAIHDNDAQAIGSMNGKLLHSHIYNNGTSSAFQGETAAGVKGIDEFEAAYNFVHDNPANGIWCDHGCNNVSTMPNGFWVHDNLVVNNGRWGVRMEFAPRIKSGVHSSQPTALVENNSIHANGYKGTHYGGASMWDAQNATFRNNTFGPKTVAGVSYRANVNKRAILFYDSGRADRTDLWNGDAVGNSLGGEQVFGCEQPDSVVYCSNNR